MDAASIGRPGVKALTLLGLFVVGAIVVVFGMLKLMAATTPDQSSLDQEVQVTVLSSTAERRASSSSRFGHRVHYTYDFAGTTYSGEGFLPLKYWQPGLPLTACVNPDNPADHALRLHRDVRCGNYVGTEQTATPKPPAD